MSIEPLVFKIITDADDSGIKKYHRGLDDIDISGRKASTTIRSFVAELDQSTSGADFGSAALSEV